MPHSNHSGLHTEDLLGMFVGYVCLITVAIFVGISYILGYFILWTLFGLRIIHQFIRRRKGIIKTTIHSMLYFVFIAATCWISSVVASRSFRGNPSLESPMQSNSMDIQSNAVVFDDQWVNLKNETSNSNPMTFEFQVDTDLFAFSNLSVFNCTSQPLDWQMESMMNERVFSMTSMSSSNAKRICFHLDIGSWMKEWGFLLF